jgi:ATP-dependent 26S proteasome regulatory subunit
MTELSLLGMLLELVDELSGLDGARVAVLATTQDASALDPSLLQPGEALGGEVCPLTEA